MNRYNELKDIRLITEAALESSLAGFWDWNMVTDEEYLSPRFKEMFGYQEDEMDNTPESWQKIAVQEDLPAMFDAFQKHIDSKGIIPFNSIVRYHHKNGNIVWVRCNGKVVEWSDDQKPLRAIGCHVDITNERQKEIILSNNLAERNILLSEVHHRVKNNLQMIISISRLKQKNNKLDFSDIETTIASISSAHEAIYQSENLKDIILSDYLYKVITPILAGQNVSLNIEESTLAMNISSLIPIGLIISECVNNSLKHAFSINSEKIITLSCNKDNDSISIIYRDNGEGFPSEVLNSLDELDSFGLSLMKSLAEQINGEIRFSNEDGAKVDVIYKLPLST